MERERITSSQTSSKFMKSVRVLLQVSQLLWVRLWPRRCRIIDDVDNKNHLQVPACGPWSDEYGLSSL